MTSDQLLLLQALATLSVVCFLLGYLGTFPHRWMVERHEKQRAAKLAELRAYAAALAGRKGEGNNV